MTTNDDFSTESQCFWYPSLNHVVSIKCYDEQCYKQVCVYDFYVHITAHLLNAKQHQEENSFVISFLIFQRNNQSKSTFCIIFQGQITHKLGQPQVQCFATVCNLQSAIYLCKDWARYCKQKRKLCMPKSIFQIHQG